MSLLLSECQEYLIHLTLRNVNIFQQSQTSNVMGEVPRRKFTGIDAD